MLTILIGEQFFWGQNKGVSLVGAKGVINSIIDFLNNAREAEPSAER